MRFSRKAQSAYSILLPRSLDTFQCRTYSAQFPLPGEHSLPGIAACDNGVANLNTIICHILPGPHLYTWVESSNVDKVPCWGTKVHGDGEIRTRALSVRVKWNTPTHHNTQI